MTGGAFIHLSWTPPGGQKEPIPASAFFHDPQWPKGPTAVALVPRPGGAKTFDGHRFLVCDPSLPWHAAQRRCERMGGHLAWARSLEESQFFRTLAPGKTFWLGASDELNEGRWEWIDGTRLDPALADWTGNEPNGGRDENYLGEHENGGWNDVAGANRFACEWDE